MGLFLRIVRNALSTIFFFGSYKEQVSFWEKRGYLLSSQVCGAKDRVRGWEWTGGRYRGTPYKIQTDMQGIRGNGLK